MRRLSFLTRLWRNTVHRAHVERDLDDELRAALEILADEKIRVGMTPAEPENTSSPGTDGIVGVVNLPVATTTRSKRSSVCADPTSHLAPSRRMLRTRVLNRMSGCTSNAFA